MYIQETDTCPSDLSEKKLWDVILSIFQMYPNIYGTDTCIYFSKSRVYVPQIYVREKLWTCHI